MDDNLESLDNTTLREKCKQYGLPNVPVTDSSRKVLIKRLRLSMGGGGDKAAKPREATPKKSNALNTTASEKATPRKTQTRRTIAADAPLPKPHIEKTTFVPTRPTVEKTTFVPTRSTVEKTTTARPTVEKNQNVLLFSNFSSQQEEERPFQRSSSLTPSEKLAKSGVFTTSYNQETTVLEDDYEDEPYISQVPTERNATRPLPTYQIGQGLAHPIGGFFKNTETQSYISKPTVESNFTRSSPSSTVPSYGLTSGPTYLASERSYNRNTFNALSQPKIDVNKPTLTRRYTEYTTTTVSDNDDEDEVEEVETPYLSSFARSLDRLKSGEISKLTPSASARKQTSLFGQRQSYGYHKSSVADDSVSGALRQFVIALENKYQLKRAFALFLAFVLVVFIYVFFIM